MAHHYNLWLEYSEDWRRLRDFMFDACKCTRFWAGPGARQEGRPDDVVREYYGVYNDHNIVSLEPGVDSSTYKNNVHVLFTLNNHERWAEWQEEVIDASIRWLAKSTGDALIDWDGLPIVGRKDDGPIVINDFALAGTGRRVTDAAAAPYQRFITSILTREGLSYQKGPLSEI